MSLSQHPGLQRNKSVSELIVSACRKTSNTIQKEHIQESTLFYPQDVLFLYSFKPVSNSVVTAAAGARFVEEEKTRNEKNTVKESKPTSGHGGEVAVVCIVAVDERLQVRGLEGNADILKMLFRE